MTQIAATEPTEPTEAPKAARTAGRGALDRSVGFDVIAHVLLIIWSLLVVLPLLWVLISSFKTTDEVLGNPLTWPHHFDWHNYVNAWTGSGVGRYFVNTVIVVGCALVIVMILGAMCSYVLARFRFFGNRFIYYLMLAGLTFPVFLAIVPLFFILKNVDLLNTLPGLILTYVAFALPFTVFFLHAFFKRLPYDVYEAAQVDGAGEWRTFFQVMLPMARPGMASVAIFNFLGLWNQFLLPIALNTQTSNYVLTQGMAEFESQAGYAVDFGALFAAVVITVAPVLVVYIIFQRQLRGSVVAGALK
jgi:N-acetylglucosamine transport system permease protein